MFIQGQRADGVLLINIGDGKGVLLNQAHKTSSPPFDLATADPLGPWTPIENAFEVRLRARLSLAVSRTMPLATFHLAPLDAEARREAALKAWDVRGRKQQEQQEYARRGQPVPAGATARAREAAAASRFRKGGDPADLVLAKKAAAQAQRAANREAAKALGQGNLDFRQVWDADKKQWVERPADQPAKSVDTIKSETSVAAVDGLGKPAKELDDTLNTPTEVGSKPGEEVSARHLGGGINTSFILTTPSGEKVFKPVSGEDFEGVRADITNAQANLAEREVIAARIDKALGFNLVPKTELALVSYKDSDGSANLNEVGMLQDFAKHDHGVRLDTVPKDEMARVAIFDAVIGNLDRHMGNFLTNKGHAIAIDHGYSLGETPVGHSVRSFALANLEKGHLTPKAQKAIASRIDKLPWADILRGGHLNAKEVRTLKQRAAHIVTRLNAGEAHLLQKDFGGGF